MWRMAAPAWAASIALDAICCGEMGRNSDMLGVCTAPVTAQVIMTLRVSAVMMPNSSGRRGPAGDEEPLREEYRKPRCPFGGEFLPAAFLPPENERTRKPLAAHLPSPSSNA